MSVLTKLSTRLLLRTIIILFFKGGGYFVLLQYFRCVVKTATVGFALLAASGAPRARRSGLDEHSAGQADFGQQGNGMSRPPTTKPITGHSRA